MRVSHFPFVTPRVAMLAALLISLAAGCGPRAAGVSGVVTLDGKPLPRARVVLMAADGRAANDYYIAETDGDGRFSLGPIGKTGAGVKPGPYKLSLTTAFSSTGDDAAPIPRELVPPPHTTGIDYEVPPGGTAEMTIALTSTRK